MLTYRTQILFDEETIKILKQLAKEQNTTVGKLVRAAVKQNYAASQQYSKRLQAWETIVHLRPKTSSKPIDYKELIAHGRNF